VFVRLLGAERRNLQARSRTFVVPWVDSGFGLQASGTSDPGSL